MMNCVGSSLNGAWIEAGAKVSSGSIRNNYLPEPTTFFFWNNWKSGQSFENAVTNAYRRTISIVNDAVKGILGKIPFMSSVASSFNFENYDFVKDSAPVIQGLRSATISTDNLTFTQSLSSGLATTVLPVSLLQSLSTSRQFSDGKMPSGISKQGLDLIKKFEGFRAKMYNDPVGHCTIGYGTLLHHGNCNGDPSEQPYVNGITEDKAVELVKAETGRFQKTIHDTVKVDLNQNQFDALVSFTYNVGPGAFSQSTLLKVLNEGKYDAVPAEIKKWTKGRLNGQLVDLPGLVTRRNEEAALFCTPVSTAQSFSVYSSPFSGVNYTVPGIVAEIKQPTPNTCWAAVMTIMTCWKNNQSKGIRDTLAGIGQTYVQMFDADRGLDSNTAGKLYADAGMESIISFNPTIEGWEGLLKQYGPLYVDIGRGNTVTHAVIVTAIIGDGTRENTSISYLDPIEGRKFTVNFGTFLRMYEAENAVRWPYTIVHWPSNVLSATKSIDYYSRPFYDTGEHAIFGEFINNAISGPIASTYPLLPTTTYSIQGVPFTYGQIITMGDFYDTAADMQKAPSAELNRLKALIIRSENHYKNTIFGIGAATGDVSNEDWASPEKGIGKRFLDLAITNNSHFAPPPAGTSSSKANNRQSWELYHAQAIKIARGGNNSSALDAAYVVNAFGDHFLTDAFSAGHLLNKEIVMNKFINNVMSGGSVNSVGKKMFEKIADKALAIPEVNKKLGRFEVATGTIHWDLNDTGFWYPEVFYRILIKVMEDKAKGTQKIANLAVKAVHDFLNEYNGGVPVKNNKGNSWGLAGDGTVQMDKKLDNVKIIQLAVKQSVENIEDSVRNASTPLSVFYQKVWDYVPNLNDPATSRIVNTTIDTYTNPNSGALIDKAVSLIKGELNTLLDELISGGYIRCIKKHDAKSVKDCEKA